MVDTWIDRAPYYAGRPVPTSAIAYTPIRYAPGSIDAPIFDPNGKDGSPVAILVGSMNAYLDSLAGAGGLKRLGPLRGTPPDVHFGCEVDLLDECVAMDDTPSFGPPVPRMKLGVEGPSAEWTESAHMALQAADADAVIMMTLQVGQYWPRQTNWRGSKALDLGTDRTASLPWLTALDMPVRVLQLTGALIGPDGRAFRIGAEGLVARRTPILASGFGAQSLLTDEDVQALLTERLDDQPGSPLVWRVALRTLMGQLMWTETLRARGAE